MTAAATSDDYGEKLYNNKELFEALFPDFEEKQKIAARLMWKRILSRNGQDPEIPRITQVVDFGCGEGTFLKCLAEQKKEFDEGLSVVAPMAFMGLDSSGSAIDKAKGVDSSHGVSFQVCAAEPDAALDNLDVRWEQAALLIMGHTWFHLDQESLIETILKLRPALVLIDVYSTWDSVMNNLRDGEDNHDEHGRKVEDNDNVENSGTYWLRTKKLPGDSSHIQRGIYKDGTGWVFSTNQSNLTTNELFGCLTNAEVDKKGPDELLVSARSQGKFQHKNVLCDGEPILGYVRVRNIPNPTAWGQMNTHVMVCADPLAHCLNRSFLSAVKGAVDELVTDGMSKSGSSENGLLSLFDDTSHDSTSADREQIPGSREAIIIQPFDPCLTFANVTPLFKSLDQGITKHPMLVENPSRSQIQFPSAYGIFQTCLARSSSAQAFPAGWAIDYHLTPVDQNFGELENKILGLDREGKWPGEIEPASYFMVPFYFGSLPLFCLALKFPKAFCPNATSFDVYYSTIKSLHDAVMVSIDDHFIRTRIIRPWVDGVLNSPEASHFWQHGEEVNLEDKLDTMERYLFGSTCTCDGELPKAHRWRMHEERCGGVLGKPWKSWILGLPSHPINQMKSVVAENKRLWSIWQKEKQIAKMDAPMRISLWFQEGNFFEETNLEKGSGHDEFHCGVHLVRLRKMFRTLGYEGVMKSGVNDDWIPEAVEWLEQAKPLVKNYFGKHVSHFLFRWMCEQLKLIPSLQHDCKDKSECSAAKCPRTTGPFFALKAVLCKSMANKGPKVRFGRDRIYHILDAARYVNNQMRADIDPTTIDQIKSKFEFAWRENFQSKFWSDEDPTLLLGEFVHALAKMENLKSVNLVEMKDPITEDKVIIHLDFQLEENKGGAEADELNRIRESLTKLGVSVSDQRGTNPNITIHFAMSVKGEVCKMENTGEH